MNEQEKIDKIRSLGYWVRVCESGPVKYIIAEAEFGDEDGALMLAGDSEVLDEALCYDAVLRGN